MVATSPWVVPAPPATLPVAAPTPAHGPLHHPGDSPLHRAPAHLKVAGLLAFVLLVVATPREWFAAYAAYLVVVLTAATAVARVPLRTLLPRLVVETPFVVFALVLPFVAHGERIDVAGVSLSEPGLLGAFALLAKGTLGVLAGLTLAATTTPHQLLDGLRRLRVPALLVDIAGFMVRYATILNDELRRMRIARESRGFAASGPRAWPVLARTLGALFIRAFERGERVHLAMLARGHDAGAPAGRPAR